MLCNTSSRLMEPAMRFELMTSSLPRRRSTPELRGRESTTNRESKLGAGDETRTRDPQLGRLMLYQLSYTRPTKFGMRNSDCSELAFSNPKSAFRNPKFSLWCRG